MGSINKSIAQEVGPVGIRNNIFLLLFGQIKYLFVIGFIKFIFLFLSMRY